MRTEKDVRAMNIISVWVVVTLLGLLAMAILTACGEKPEKKPDYKEPIMVTINGEKLEGYEYTLDVRFGTVLYRYGKFDKGGIAVATHLDGTLVQPGEVGFDLEALRQKYLPEEFE